MTSPWPALIGFAGVIVGALLAAVTAAHRERLARRETSQREALHLLQESCLRYRRSLQRFATSQTAEGAEREQARAAVEEALQDLDLVEARILCDTVLDRVVTWRDLAKLALLHDDLAPVTATEENAAWLEVQTVVKQELRRLSSPRLWPQRAG